jgi:gamma-glutamylcyclotransferase (GGCT)/AIG2-like uncharacterized protein YtfP
MSLLFTYGTLQRSQRNHWRLYGSRFVASAVARGQLFQFRGPGMDFPLLCRNQEGLVHGEIYEVSRGVLDIQDWYEMLYKRVKLMAYPYGAGPVLSCWVYEGLNTLPYQWARRLPNGRWPGVEGPA